MMNEHNRIDIEVICESADHYTVSNVLHGLTVNVLLLSDDEWIADRCDEQTGEMRYSRSHASFAEALGGATEHLIETVFGS